MRRDLKIILFVLITVIAVACCTTAVFADDNIGGEYAITQDDNWYYAENSEKSYKGNTLNELLDLIPENNLTLIFSSVSCNEDVSLSENVTVRGELLISGSIICNASAILFDSAKIEAEEIYIRTGRTEFKGSSVTLTEGSGIKLNYSSSAELYLTSSEISAVTMGSAVDVEIGSAFINDSKISNPYGACISNSASLFLGGESVFLGYDTEIITSRPIHLTSLAESFAGDVDVCYLDIFEKGEFYTVFLDADAKNLNGINIVDESSESFELNYFSEHRKSSEKNILAVSIPYHVAFISSGEKVYECEKYKDEKLDFLPDARKEGYSFLGWHSTGEETKEYSAGATVTSDLELVAEYSLAAPSYVLSSLEFTYDAQAHPLEVSSLEHPLLVGGIVSYDWYKNGESINCYKSSVDIKNVSDSGMYFCKLLFSYNGENVAVITESVEVNVLKKRVKIPNIPPVEYTGEPISPSLDSNEYSIDFEANTNAGSYPLILTLLDTENCVWESGEQLYEYTEYKINKAQNAFTEAPRAADIYEGQAPTPSAKSKFGAVRYLYSSDGVSFGNELPEHIGKVYGIAIVDDSENYHGITSEIFSFTILRDKVVSLALTNPPIKTDYVAFDSIDMAGAQLLVFYESGREAVLSHDMFSCSYVNGSYLCVADKYVIASYGGKSVAVPVNVALAEYDLSGLKFASEETVYNGKRQTVTASGLVFGKDGIGAEYSVRGGGVNVGAYEIRLSFTSVSPNYKKPDDIVVTLTVAPCPVTLEYSSLSFVYDGTYKLPEASFIGVRGAKIPVQLVGSAKNAGSYTATAEATDENYLFENPTVSFTVNKAHLNLSGVSWLGGSFAYDGTAHSVTASGLPPEATVGGYINASFTNAGNYTAELILSYDMANYETPERLLYDWKIEPADYDMNGFGFLDSDFIFDKEEHYPEFFGSLPVGLDGSSPSYTFSRGATHVSQGIVSVEILFSSSSRNYRAPDKMSANVRILPKSVLAEWGECNFIWDGGYKSPTARCDECELSVSGSSNVSGTFIATAVSKNSNYKVVNGKISFTVAKAENSWLQQPSALNIYEGAQTVFFAKSKYGEVEFRVFSDAAATVEVDYPTRAGIYYFVAAVAEGENYLQLRSEPKQFSVIEIKPSELRINLSDKKFFAMQRLGASDFEASFVNNDGSIAKIDFESISVIYSDGESLKRKDTSVSFCCGGLIKEVRIEVQPAVYDMSGVRWENNFHTYDGREKTAVLAGLPDGVEVAEYITSSGTEAGSIKLEARLMYDSENYAEPVVPDGWLVINKAAVSLPEIEDLIYSGRYLQAVVEYSPLYTYSVTGGTDAGEYEVSFTLNDAKNYEFSDGICEKKYRIQPVKLTVEMTGKSTYVITDGEVFAEDSLGVEYYTEDGKYWLKASNPNYAVTVVPKKADNGIFLLLIIILSLILVSLAVFILVGRRDIVFTIGKAPMRQPIKEEKKSAPKNEAEPAEDSLPGELKTLLEVDEPSANRLISDLLAKSLISEDKVRVRTSGKHKATVNIGEISAAFAKGETVDINSLKAKGLVKKDAKSVKILGAGTLDKPLHVRANAFSLGAVKMIALTGGKAEKIHTERIIGKQNKASGIEKPKNIC